MPKPRSLHIGIILRSEVSVDDTDRILLIATDSWSVGDGFHSPAHRVRSGTRGPWQDDPPRSGSRDRRGRSRGRRDHAAHRGNGGPARGDPQDVRGPPQRAIVPHSPPPLHPHTRPTGPLPPPRPPRPPPPPPRAPHRRPPGIPAA